jgi:hypothetical protein
MSHAPPGSCVTDSSTTRRRYTAATLQFCQPRSSTNALSCGCACVSAGVCAYLRNPFYNLFLFYAILLCNVVCGVNGDPTSKHHKTPLQALTHQIRSYRLRGSLPPHQGGHRVVTCFLYLSLCVWWRRSYGLAGDATQKHESK